LDHSIDFELSDEESEDQKELHSNRQRVDELMREKSVLEEELRRIEVELVQLED
jgi:predicted nuclease with TOPRIM domain